MSEDWSDSALADPRADRDWPWRANLRLLQSWWRHEVLGSPPGPGPKKEGRPHGGWLPLARSEDDEGRNFFDDRVVRTIDRRLHARGWGGLVGEDRLRRSLLSSQPLCFNLFGVLQDHPDVLVAWLRSIGVDAVEIERTDAADVDLVRIEYAPPRRTHLGSGSAFDACITYRDERGQRGVVAVETKYAENLADQKITTDAKYDEATTSSGLWKATAPHRLNQPSPVQAWQNLLLVQKAVELGTHGWSRGTFVMLSDGRDRGAVGAAATVWSQLVEPEPWVRWSSYQDVVNVARRSEEAAPWAEWFTTRYLDLSPIESLLIDDPNRNPTPIGASGDAWPADNFREAVSDAIAHGVRVLGEDSVLSRLAIDRELTGPLLALVATSDHLRGLTELVAEAQRLAAPIVEAMESPGGSD